MSFRRRLTLACAAAVALAVVLAAGLTYWFVRDTLRDQIDDSLRSAQPLAVELPPRDSAAVADRLERIRAQRLQSPLDGPVLFVQRLAPGGEVQVPPGQEPAELVGMGVMEAVAAGEREPFFADVEREGRHLRVFTTGTPEGGALQVARSLDEVDGTLATPLGQLPGIGGWGAVVRRPQKVLAVSQWQQPSPEGVQRRGGANLQQEVNASPDRKDSPAAPPKGILAAAFRE